ncbi:MAG: glutamine--fructose-6-phosphate transaminase (isomerizing) [Bacilli bacterium]|nr:glutamine--fructose-6-phosphate transaminase (isomerizing) [Bacilli bacterium]
MCGIVGYIGKKCDLKKVLIDNLKTLEYRGYDSAGVAIYDGNINIVKAKGKIVNLENSLKDVDICDSNLGIAHTRWATHGEANDINSHPHRVGKVTLVHNGIIENYNDLKKDLIRQGYIFVSDTDTEVLVALLDSIKKKEKDNIKAINSLSKLLIGSYALGIIFDDDCEHLYAVRKDSPLIIGVCNDCNLIASDVTAIIDYTKKYMLIDDYEIAKLGKDIVEVFNSDLLLVNKEISEVTWDINQAKKNGFSHFMLKEINEEPIVLKETISEYIKDVNALIKKMPDFSKYNKIHIVACGSAMHAGLVGKSIIEEYAGIPVIVELASEYRYKKNFYDSKTLVIFISQSGETADTIAALRNVNNDNIDTLAIVNVVGSTIAREAKEVLYIRAGVEIAVATTKAYLLQVAMLILVGLNLAYTNKKLSENEVNFILNEFEEIPSKIQNIICRDSECFNLAKEIYEAKDVFFLGRGIDYSICMEGSLKLKEISYIHSEAYAAGELKHGTISLIEKGTNVIGVITDESLMLKTLSNIKETVARGAKVLLITTDKFNSHYDFNCHEFVVEKVNSVLQPLLIVVPLQLIAFEVARLRGCDIDKPRNLAKSVTVE